MNHSHTIVVTGATGVLGSAVIEFMQYRGFNVTAGTTDPAKKPQVNGVNTQRVVFEDLASIDAVLNGAYGLFLMAPPMDSASDTKLIPVIDLAISKGIKHVVFNSALGVDMAEQSPLNKIEKHLAASGVNHTILRPNFFMENFSAGFLLSMVAHGGIFLAAGEGKTSFISAKDIAATAAAAFEKKLYSRAFNLTGMESLDHAEVAATISELTGKIIRYHPLAEADMLKGARDNGMPESSVQMMGSLYEAVRQGFMAGITEDVKHVTGRNPIRFREFVMNNKNAWK